MAKYLETKPGSLEEAIRQVNEKSVSQAQQKAAGAALSAKRGEISPSELVGASKEMYDSMTEKQLQDFAKTKHKGLPKKRGRMEALDKVNPDAVKKKFDDRKDKDIDNDGDVDSTDKYLHKRRKAVSKAIAKEEVKLAESKVKRMRDAGVELEKYAKKSGGIDKNDMMKAAGMMKKLDLDGLAKFVKGMDTDPRDKVMQTVMDYVGKDAAKRMFEEVELDENTWQVIRNYADGKFSPSPMQGFRTEKEAQKRAAELNKKEKTKDTFSVRYNTMKFRGESYDIGTDEYAKHTMDTTPGQNNEDYLKQLHGKNYSMREALAKVWNVDEGKSPFEPEKKIKLSDAMKDGKTDTGKKMTKVTVSENKEAEKIIIDTLKKEGGAAGMSALEKAVKDKGIDVDVKDLVSKMSNVKTHEHGDIILVK